MVFSRFQFFKVIIGKTIVKQIIEKIEIILIFGYQILIFLIWYMYTNKKFIATKLIFLQR